MPKLTQRTVQAVKPRADREVFIWDDEIPGFGLRIKSTGAKSFLEHPALELNRK